MLAADSLHCLLTESDPLSQYAVLIHRVQQQVLEAQCYNPVSPDLLLNDFRSSGVLIRLPIIFQPVPMLKCGLWGRLRDQLSQLWGILIRIIQDMCMPDPATAGFMV